MDEAFLTLAGAASTEVRVRGSRFIGLAAPAGDEAEARRVLEDRSRIHFDATHNCAAWHLRDGTRRALDAGEPSGSAGAPILAAIDARALLDAVVVVSRYFGGMKLGIGGLVRAYGEAAAAALDAAPRRWAIPGARVRLRYPYAATAPVMRALDRFHADSIDHGYEGADAAVTFNVAAGDLDELTAALREDTGGRGRGGAACGGVVLPASFERIGTCSAPIDILASGGEPYLEA